MKKYIAAASLLSLLVSCAPEKAIQPPADLVGEDKMVELMVDLHVMQAALSLKNLPQDSSNRLYTTIEKQVLERHGVPEPSFRSSNAYYLNEVQMMDVIYARVVDSLSHKETQINAGLDTTAAYKKTILFHKFVSDTVKVNTEDDKG